MRLKMNSVLDRAAYSCILHALKLVWNTESKSWVPQNKMSADEAEWWGQYAYQLATTGPYRHHLHAAYERQ
jgi:hypothetical protein